RNIDDPFLAALAIRFRRLRNPCQLQPARSRNQTADRFVPPKLNVEHATWKIREMRHGCRFGTTGTTALCRGAHRGFADRRPPVAARFSTNADAVCRPEYAADTVPAIPSPQSS